MATGNALNANQAGFQSYDGAGNFNGRTLQAGANVTISNGDGVSGNPSISVPNIMTWTEVTGTSQAMAINSGYVANNASLITFSLPASANVGDAIQILGKGAG